MRIAWATDVHLDCVTPSRAAHLCARIRASGAEAVLLGGDTALAPELAPRLAWLDRELGVPTYFVLGNHDYYGGDVATVEAAARRVQTPTLRWLPDAGVVPLTRETALVGHGGWGDLRHGDFLASEVWLTDYEVIGDLCRAGEAEGGVLGRKRALMATLGALGDAAASTLRPALEGALRRFPRVLVLTHVPPFREACWHQGRISTDDWLPGFTCKAVGDLLLDAADRLPDRQITVLCGHTHGEGEARLRPNLLAVSQGAEYGKPDFRILEVA